MLLGICGASQMGEGSSAPVACPRETAMNPAVPDTECHNLVHEDTARVNG